MQFQESVRLRLANVEAEITRTEDILWGLQRERGHLAALLEPAASEEGKVAVRNSPSRHPSFRATRSSPNRIRAFRFLGVTKPVDTFRALLVELATTIYRSGVDDFDRIGQVRPFSRDSSRMIAPRPIGDSGVWVDANLSAKDIRTACEKVVRLFGYPPDSLEVDWTLQ